MAFVYPTLKISAEAAAARVLVPDRAALAIVVEGAGVLRVEAARVFLADQLAHHAEQVDQASSRNTSV